MNQELVRNRAFIFRRGFLKDSSSEAPVLVQDRVLGFSAIELVLVLTIMGVLAMLMLPTFSSQTLTRLSSTAVAREIASDLRRTRFLAVSDAPSNPNGYALRMTGGPPYTGYDIINLKTSVTVVSKGISKDVSVTGGSDFSFGPLGNLLSGSGLSLTVSGAGRQYAITLTPATGSTKLEEQ